MMEKEMLQDDVSGRIDATRCEQHALFQCR